MIVKVIAYFREGAFSYYPGETHHDADLTAQRDFSPERIQQHLERGHLEQTGDADPQASPVSEGHLQAAMAATGAEELKTGLAEDGMSAAMPEQQRKARAKE